MSHHFLYFVIIVNIIQAFIIFFLLKCVLNNLYFRFSSSCIVHFCSHHYSSYDCENSCTCSNYKYSRTVTKKEQPMNFNSKIIPEKKVPLEHASSGNELAFCLR